MAFHIEQYISIDTFVHLYTHLKQRQLNYRFASCVKFDSTGHGTVVAHCTFSYICNHHICNHRIGVIFRDVAHYLLG